MSGTELVLLDGAPTEQGWYWCCEAYLPYAMCVLWVSQHGGHSEHQVSYAEAAEIEAQWWGPIEAPKQALEEEKHENVA